MKSLVSQLGEKESKEIAEAVVRGYELDWNSMEDFRERANNWSRLMAALSKKKTFPWDGASNVKMPVLSTAVIQFQAKSANALITANPVKVKKVGTEDSEQAHRVETYMNYYLNRKMGWSNGQDRTLMRVPSVGVAFKKVFFNKLTNRIESSLRPWNAVVIDANAESLETARRISEKLIFYKNDLLRYKAEEVFEFDSIETLLPVKVERTEDESIGLSEYIEDEPIYAVIEQSCYLYYDVNGDTLIDSEIAKPFLVWVDLGSSKILALEPNGDENGNPIQYYIRYPFIPNPETAIYDWGFGVLLEDMNEAINTAANQIMDAGTLSTTRSGLISKRIGLRRGKLEFKMGELVEVDIPSMDDIKKHVHIWDFKEPSTVLFNMLGMMFTKAGDISSVNDITTGKMPERDTAATSIVRLIEEGKAVYNSIYSRIYRAMAQEFDIIKRLIHENLDLDEYVNVLGDNYCMNFITGNIQLLTPENQRMATAAQQAGTYANFCRSAIREFIKNDFASGPDVIPMADPNAASQAEEIERANFVLQDALADPSRASNPDIMYKIRKRVYEAVKIQNLSEVLPSDAQPPQADPSANWRESFKIDLEQLTPKEAAEVLTKAGITPDIEGRNALQQLKVAQALKNIQPDNGGKDAKTEQTG